MGHVQGGQRRPVHNLVRRRPDRPAGGEGGLGGCGWESAGPRPVCAVLRAPDPCHPVRVARRSLKDLDEEET